jgi:hypothetical protein
VLVFAFLPVVVVLPGWMYFEATNPLNLQDPIVLVFAPLRALVRMLNAFFAGMVPGLVGGLTAGVLLALVATRVPVAASTHPRLVGAGCGAVAGLVVVASALAPLLATSGAISARLGAATFELLSAVACGVVAGPTAVRWLIDPPREPVSEA